MWIIKINAITNLVAFIIGSLQYKYFSKELKIIYYFVAFGIFTEVFTKFFKIFVMRNTMPIGHFYFPIAFLLAGLFYTRILEGFIKPVYLISIIIMFEVYAIINSVFVQSLFEYASLVGAIGSMLIFMFAVAFFVKVMNEAKINKLSREPLIWINTAILIYFTFNFFYYSLFNLLVSTSKEAIVIAVLFFSGINLLFYFLIGIAFLIYRKINIRYKHVLECDEIKSTINQLLIFLDYFRTKNSTKTDDRK